MKKYILTALSLILVSLSAFAENEDVFKFRDNRLGTSDFLGW